MCLLVQKIILVMKQKFAFITAILSLAFGLQSNVFGQWIPTNGPAECPVYSFAFSGPNLLAVTNNGTFLSADHGESWKLISDLPIDVSTFGSFGNILFAETSKGIFVSMNNGANWALADSTFRSAQVFTALGSSIFAGTHYDNNSIYLSIDSGRSWKPSCSGMNNINVNALAESNNSLFAGTDKGIFRSDDSGVSWKMVNTATYVDAFGVSGNNIYAGIWGGGGFYRSSDNGDHWVQTNTGLVSRTVGAIHVVGNNIFVGTGRGVFQTTVKDTIFTNRSDSLPFGPHTFALASDGLYLYTGAQLSIGVWRRPLSELITLTPDANIPNPKMSLSTYPNPFSEVVTIKLSFAGQSFAQISIFDPRRSQTFPVFADKLYGGDNYFTWEAHSMPSGMYFCMANVGGYVQQLPIMLVK